MLTKFLLSYKRGILTFNHRLLIGDVCHVSFYPTLKTRGRNILAKRKNKGKVKISGGKSQFGQKLICSMLGRCLCSCEPNMR